MAHLDFCACKVNILFQNDKIFCDFLCFERVCACFLIKGEVQNAIYVLYFCLVPLKSPHSNSVYTNLDRSKVAWKTVLPPLILLTKLDEPPLFLLYRIRGSSSLVRRKSEGKAEVVVAQILNWWNFCQLDGKYFFTTWIFCRFLVKKLLKNVKLRAFFYRICCFLSKMLQMQSFFLKNIWCVRKQLVILHSEIGKGY